jgi:hypothetical protein
MSGSSHGSLLVVTALVCVSSCHCSFQGVTDMFLSFMFLLEALPPRAQAEEGSVGEGRPLEVQWPLGVCSQRMAPRL